MNESQLKARATRLRNHLKKKKLTVTYERQAEKKKNGYYEDTRKRIA